MKTILISLFALTIALGGYAQKKKPVSPPKVLKTDLYTVNYGSPSKKGRVIFGELVPFGQVWRTGANEATQITFNQDVMFGDQNIKAGTYTLFTVPNEDNWTVVLNSELKQWGAYKYDPKKNVAEIVVPAQTIPDPQESFTIIDGDTGNILLSWDTTQIEIPVAAK